MDNESKGDAHVAFGSALWQTRTGGPNKLADIHLQIAQVLQEFQNGMDALRHCAFVLHDIEVRLAQAPVTSAGTGYLPPAAHARKTSVLDCVLLATLAASTTRVPLAELHIRLVKRGLHPSRRTLHRHLERLIAAGMVELRQDALGAGYQIMRATVTKQDNHDAHDVNFGHANGKVGQDNA